MSDWADIANDSLAAAKELKESGRVRSCLSRAYYSAYAGVTGELVSCLGSIGPNGRENPGHEQVVKMVKHNLNPERFSLKQRQELGRCFKRLLSFRIEADYDPSSSLDEQDAVLSLKHASRVLAILGSTK